MYYVYNRLYSRNRFYGNPFLIRQSYSTGTTGATYEPIRKVAVKKVIVTFEIFHNQNEIGRTGLFTGT